MRMKQGQYGRLGEGCGVSIPLARLNALPYATLCIDCQREAEKYGSSGSGDTIGAAYSIAAAIRTSRLMILRWTFRNPTFRTAKITAVRAKRRGIIAT